MKFYLSLYASFVILAAIANRQAFALKTILSKDLTAVVNGNEHLLVLFVEPDCEPCKNAERQLEELLAGTGDTLPDVTVVRVAEMSVPKTLGVNNKPALLFFRHSKPAIYDGLIEAKAIEEWMEFNKDSVLRSLNDDNFEHLTQAGTGATTGDWLVVFCQRHTDACKNHEAIFETVALKLRGQRNAAYVDSANNPSLVQRFGLTKDMTILFFRLGKIYQYDVKKIDVASLVSFAQHFYKNVPAVPVPIQPSPFDNLTDTIAKMIKENDWVMWPAAGVLVGLIFLLLCTGKKSAGHARKVK